MTGDEMEKIIAFLSEQNARLSIELDTLKRSSGTNIARNR